MRRSRSLTDAPVSIQPGEPGQQPRGGEPDAGRVAGPGDECGPAGEAGEGRAHHATPASARRPPTYVAVTSSRSSRTTTSATPPGWSTPRSAAAQQPRRDGGGRPQRLRFADPEADELAHGAVHGQHAAREGAVGQARLGPADLDRARAEPVGPVPQAGRLHRVGDEGEPAARRERGQQRGLGREVDAVHDGHDDDVAPDERDAAQAGVAVRPPAVGVVDMRHRAGAGVVGRVGGGRVGVGVPAGDDDAAGGQAGDEGERAGELGRQRHERHVAGVEQPVGQPGVGGAQVARVVRAGPARGEERPLEVDAGDGRRHGAGTPRPPLRPGGLARGAERAHQVLLGRRDERRQPRRHARRGQRRAGPGEVVGLGGQGVDPGEPVDLEVDEARRGHARGAGTGRQPGGRDPAVVAQLDVAGNELAADERVADPESRRAHAVGVTLDRPRGASGSRPRSRASASATCCARTAATIAASGSGRPGG